MKLSFVVLMVFALSVILASTAMILPTVTGVVGVTLFSGEGPHLPALGPEPVEAAAPAADGASSSPVILGGIGLGLFSLLLLARELIRLN